MVTAGLTIDGAEKRAAALFNSLVERYELKLNSTQKILMEGEIKMAMISENSNGAARAILEG
jgi:hypothetical protein